ncbi:hypothetical protein BACCIP111895_04289 [Neobacillus rhizosphaerae]|uniref:HIRAN domain-containing protein n=1 Tax=Neobacillus rhizosphaerae TaxID=2880965 RepID=A0ABM9EWN1_9BACI|nr:hypothetical protein [Neobacillus rhizosphaerae]CAH2717100.1 hypothetical protein BACCIP111895_04289 [Neobacillus rhizosphaerae]
MGSSGVGNFGNYPGNTNPTKDMCRTERKNVGLEEVGRLEYFNVHGNVPVIMEPVVLSDQLKNGRLVVLSETTGEEIGFLPSTYSSLLACMRKGFSYRGNVVYSALRPIPKVDVDLNAHE